jgi:acetyltransferase-like isoleucine patch superfamily enzyme
MAFLSRPQLERMGFAALGEDVRISEKASIYGAARIRIGDHGRIDDFCILSAGEGGIGLGSHVHIGCFCSLIGAAEIVIQDFSALSGRVAVYSSSDDYSGNHLANPTVPVEFTNVDSRSVRLEKHVLVGAGAVILPGVVMHEGSVAGALSLVTHDCDAFWVYSGVPARRRIQRDRGLLEKEALLRRRIAETEPSAPRPP